MLSRALRNCWIFPTQLVSSTWSFPDPDSGNSRYFVLTKVDTKCILWFLRELANWTLPYYFLKVSCSGRHTLRVTGVSSLDFRAGFSTLPVSEFNHTRERPIKGVERLLLAFTFLSKGESVLKIIDAWYFLPPPGLPAHVMLKCTGLKPPGYLSQVELMSASGRSLRTIPISLPSDLGQQGLWTLPEFRTPPQSFFIKATGNDESGFRFQRLSSVSYTNIIPGKATTSNPRGNSSPKSTLHPSVLWPFNLLFPPSCRSPSCENAWCGKGLLHAACHHWLLSAEWHSLQAEIHQKWDHTGRGEAFSVSLPDPLHLVLSCSLLSPVSTAARH